MKVMQPPIFHDQRYCFSGYLCGVSSDGPGQALRLCGDGQSHHHIEGIVLEEALNMSQIHFKEAKQTVEDPVKFSSHCPLVFDKKVKPLLSIRVRLDNLSLPLFSGLWRDFVWLELSSNSPEIVIQFGQS